ncbi:MAG TPA: aminotransferase class I/II-fold pyridoxal phosphate-dependent enzyme [Gammaproteobacteria bacterium]|nr:aminotransferase class I/II-fold pyridoxal phosphate-dependent enzyme [Gammaproteobacteria bacterium]
MKLVPFVLEEWLAKYRDSVPHHLGMSTGPRWTMAELRALMTGDERDAFDRAALTYTPSNGREPLRAAIASIYGADPEEIVVFNGGAEALLTLFFVAGDRERNVVVPTPSFAPFVEIPTALGVEARRYTLRLENGFALDPEEIMRLCDANTRLILVNTPHNPSGAVVGEEAIRALDEFAQRRGIQLVVDEVYHPIYHGASARSAAEFSRASVLGDFSKSFSLPGLRIGWILERDAKRRKELENAHAYFTVCASMPSELLAEVAARNRETIWNRARAVSAHNLAPLADWCAENEEWVEWVRPRGSMTAFPRLRGASDAQPFCVAAAERGVLLAIGQAFGAPAHFRIGFGLEMPRYREALGILSDVLASRRFASNVGA